MEQTKLMGRANYFTIDGSYTYFTSVEINTSDHIVIDMKGDYVTLKCYGFIVRYLLSIRENYFGDNVHFKTFEEYSQEKQNTSNSESSSVTSADSSDLSSSDTTNSDINYWKIGRAENDIDVLFAFKVRQGLCLLPCNLYDSKKHIGLRFDSLDVDIRFTNYYMDFQADITPIDGVLVKQDDGLDAYNTTSEIIFDIPKYTEKYLKKPNLTIVGLSIHGHRMFGLPPVEPTYYCKWDIATGDIVIDSSGSFLKGLIASVGGLAVGYTDLENELVVHIPTLYDVTFLSFSCPKIHIGLHHESMGSDFELPIDADSTLNIDISSILFTFNDLANDRYTSKLSLIIPKIEVKLLKKIEEGFKVLMFFQFELNLNNISQKRKFLEHRRLQQNHIRTNDAPFHRCPFLLYPVERDDVYMDAMGCFITSLTLPDVAAPMNKDSATTSTSIADSENYPSVLDFEDESYPPSSSSSTATSTATSSQSSFASNNSTSKMKPTTNYSNEDFCPDYDIDPKYEYDNFIFDLSSIDAFISPRALSPLAKILQSFQGLDLTSLIDELQRSILRKLVALIYPGSTNVNFRFVAPEINLRVGDFDVSSPLEMLQSPKVPVINMSIVEPSFAFSEKTTNEKVSNGGSDSLNTTVELSGAVHIKEILLSISNPSEFVLAGSFDLENIEFWFTKSPTTSNNELVCSHAIDKIEVNFSTDQIEWVSNYILRMHEIIEPSLEEFKNFVEASEKAIPELVYMISKAGKEFHIDYDPDVLTKPAYILRSCRDHTRFHDSWKLMTRIRHVFDNLPEAWKENLYQSIEDNKWELPATASEEFLSIFSRWRTWEVGDVEQSYLFKEVFEKLVKIKELALLANFRADFGNICFNIRDESNKSNDFIELDNVNFTFGVNTERKVDLNSIGGLGIFEVLQKLEGVFNVISYKSKISTITFDILPKILDIKKEFGKLNKEHVLKEEHKISSIPKNQIDKFISFIASIKSFRQQLLLPYTSLELRGNSVAFTAQTYILSQSKVIPFTFSTVADEYALDLWGENQIISNSMEGLFFLVGNFGSLERGIKYGKVEIKKISIYLSEQEMCLTRAIQSIIDEDVPYVQKLITAATPEKELPPEASATPTSTEPFRSLYNKVGDVFLDFNLEELSWSLDVLFPLTYNGKVISSHFSLNVMEEAVYIELLIQRFDSIFSIKRKNMIRLENSQIQTNIKFLDSKKMYFAVCSMDIGFTKVVLPQISQTMELILKNLVLLQERVNTFQEIALDFIPSENTSIESNTLKTDKNNTDFAFKFNFSNDYIGVSSFLDRSKISFELEGFSFGTYNIANVNKEEDQSTKYLLVPIYGELVIPTARISILDRSIPVGLSSILDVNVTLKVLNSSQENDKAQSLQLESQYCRICTSPQVLFKIIELVDSVVNVISTHPITKLKKKKNVEIPKERKPFELPFASINILSYNFCFGWLFGDPNLKSYPGIIVGAERFFAVVEETVGKFTLMEAYLSVANGSRSSNYYSSLSEKNNLNRAYLPTMQIIYLMEKVESARNLRMHIFGDELDVKFLSDSIAIIEHAVKSGTKVQAFFNKRVRPTLHQPGKAPSRSPSPAENGEDENPLHAYFTSIECVYSFAGSNILLYRFNDGNSTTAEPSLYLHSPAVRVATMYKHKKEIESGSNERKHTIKIEVLTSPFDNTLYASCVPVILDIVDGVKRMMKSDSNPTASVAPVIATSSTQSSDFKLGDLLKDIDIHFRVRIEKQKLSLSCEPTAKVEAVVAIGGIDFQINSLNESPKALTSILQFESVSSTLQHVYSREVSGSIIIREIILSSKIDFGSVTRILSAGSLSDVSGYINVKQFQDLNLFKDIWLPKDYLDELHTEYESVKESISNKNLSERAKEVSTTYAVPWDLTLMITNIVLQVDFGQSLGNFNLNSNKIWVISNKTTDWGQDLKVGIDNISLTLKGRLGGTLEIKNVYLHAGISWKDGENILDIPLIILSGDVEHLQLKSSFDYHVFALANIKTCSIDIFNQKNEVTAISKDHLYITTKFETAEIYITSFAASNVMDIYNAIFRMVQENKNSYRETLRDSRKNVSKALTRSLSSPSTGGSAVHTTSSNVKRLSSGSVKSVSPHTSSSTQSSTPSKKLVSKIEVIAGHFLIHVYPSSFDDSKVMVVKLDGSQINFDESEYEDGIANDLKVQFNGLKVSLSKTSTLLEDFILTSTVNQFVEHAHKATGGTIFVFPSFKISMKTFQKYESYLIEYFFQSSFGGTVGIRWNLGSINFIREMFAIHKRALASRTSYKQEAGGAVKVSKIEVDKDVPPLEKKAVNENFDEAINATIDKVSDESKYIYQALAIPIIEAPQLKELGNATPPLEWFGLHREKFPNVTHQLGIVSLQKFIHEIEVQYSKVLGKA